MAVEKYTALANITLTSTASSVTFGSIPSGYRDLRLVVTGTITNGYTVQMRFNGDSGSNYSYVGMYGTGSSTASYSGTSTSITTGYLDTTQSMIQYQIMDYSATDKHKTVLVRRDIAATITLSSAERWANTAAITTLALIPTSSQVFNSGCTFELYGVK